MSVVSEILGNKADGHAFEHQGKTYHLNYITQKIKANYEKEVFRQARDLAQVLREDMTDEEYHQHLDRLNRQYLAGEFALESEAGRAFLNSNKGKLHFLAQLMGCGVDDVAPILIDKPEVVDLLAVVIQESYPLASKKKAQTETTT